MKKLKCKYPGCSYGEKGKPKVIEGYNKKHAEFLMMQHELKHRHDEKSNDKKEVNKNGL